MVTLLVFSTEKFTRALLTFHVTLDHILGFSPAPKRIALAAYNFGLTELEP